MADTQMAMAQARRHAEQVRRQAAQVLSPQTDEHRAVAGVVAAVVLSLLLMLLVGLVIGLV